MKHTLYKMASLAGIGVMTLASKSCATPQPQQGTANKKTNVLFIIADDLRPELGCYGIPSVQTPNIDRLARQSLLFERAYCNIPVSGASRACLFTGMYPQYPDRFTSFDAWASEDCPSAIPLSQWFTQNGYYTVSNGKVFHNLQDHAQTWSEPPFRVHPQGYGKDWAVYNKWERWLNEASGQSIHPKTLRGPYCERAAVPDTAYEDGKLALKTVADLARLKNQETPFFLVCGFWKPHLPFNAPAKYWDLYDRDSIPMASNPFLPTHLPSQVKPSTEITQYASVGDMTEASFQKEAKHGYYACVSFIDAQVGLLLDALDNNDLTDNTIIVLIGDHGWHLGEHAFWGKHNLLDNATRVPLLVSVPGGKTGRTSHVVSLVDLYPLLCDLCGLPQPKYQLEGTSFARLLQPKNATHSHKSQALIYWEQGTCRVNSRFSHSWWPDGTQMLFDNKKDPAQNHNIAKH